MVLRDASASKNCRIGTALHPLGATNLSSCVHMIDTDTATAYDRHSVHINFCFRFLDIVHLLVNSGAQTTVVTQEEKVMICLCVGPI